MTHRPWIWLLLVPLAVHWPALTGWLSENPIALESGLGRDWHSNGLLPGQPGWIDGNAGTTLQALGHLVARDWAHGVVPWWNEFSGVGMPLAGEMQPAAFFLPFVLLLGFGGGLLLLKMTMQAIAGLAMWGLLRQLGLAPTVCFVGALLFQLNGTFAWDADSSCLPVAFVPLMPLGIERALTAARAGTRGGWRVFSVALAYAILAGFPETAFFGGLLALCWAGLRLYQARGARAGFAWRVALGGMVALLVCAPVLLAFKALLGLSVPGMRGLGHAALQPGDFAMLIFPYLYGPIFFAGQYNMWFRMGGFVGLPALLLACASLAAAMFRAPARETALRWVLGGFVVLALAKAGGVPGITLAWNAIPLVSQAIFYRYAAPTWECAAIILAAFALEDFCASHADARRRIGFAALMCVAICIATLVAGRPVWRDLGSVAGGRAWFVAAVGWGIGSAGLLALAWWARWRPVLFGVLALDAWVQFSVPLLAGTRGAAKTIDLGPVAFLKAHAGLGRVFTLGPLAPNYGAYFGVAEIDHIYAPVPQDWVSYIRAHLDPQAVPVTYNGSDPPPAPGVESRPEALRHRMAAYAAIGVKYVLSPANEHPFALGPVSVHRPTSIRNVILQPGETLSGSIGAGEYDVGQVGSVGVVLATFNGRSTGSLSLELCAGGDCGHGSAALEGVAENATLHVVLDHVLTLHSADRLNFSMRHEGGTSPVAIWVWRGEAAPAASLNGPRDVPAQHLPELWLFPPQDARTARRVYGDGLVDIYELPGTAPYFEADGCQLAGMTRTGVAAHCATSRHLLRRELWFPGWRAWVNGRPAPLTEDGIFQSVMLPEGESVVRFGFVPHGIGWAGGGAALGLLALAWGKSTSFLKKRSKKLLTF